MKTPLAGNISSLMQQQLMLLMLMLAFSVALVCPSELSECLFSLMESADVQSAAGRFPVNMSEARVCPTNHSRCDLMMSSVRLFSR